MGELLRAQLARRAKFIAPKMLSTGYKTFSVTDTQTLGLSPIAIVDGSYFLMMGFVLSQTVRINGINLANQVALYEASVEFSAGGSSYKYEYVPRFIPLEGNSINGYRQMDHYLLLKTPEQINVSVTNNFKLATGGASIAMACVAIGEEYRF